MVNLKQTLVLLCFVLLSTLSHAQGTQPLSLLQTFTGVDYIETSSGQIPPPFDIVGIHQINPSTVVWVSMEGYVVFYDLSTKKISKTIQIADYIITTLAQVFQPQPKNIALPMVQVSRLVPISARLLTCVIRRK